VTFSRFRVFSPGQVFFNPLHKAVILRACDFFRRWPIEVLLLGLSGVHVPGKPTASALKMYFAMDTDPVAKASEHGLSPSTL
jgi:hypothetical protein